MQRCRKCSSSSSSGKGVQEHNHSWVFGMYGPLSAMPTFVAMTISDFTGSRALPWELGTAGNKITLL